MRMFRVVSNVETWKTHSLEKRSHVRNQNQATSYPYTIAWKLLIEHHLVIVADVVFFASMETCEKALFSFSGWWQGIRRSASFSIQRIYLLLVDVYTYSLARLLLDWRPPSTQSAFNFFQVVRVLCQSDDEEPEEEVLWYRFWMFLQREIWTPSEPTRLFIEHFLAGKRQKYPYLGFDPWWIDLFTFAKWDEKMWKGFTTCMYSSQNQFMQNYVYLYSKASSNSDT